MSLSTSAFRCMSNEMHIRAGDMCIYESDNTCMKTRTQVIYTHLHSPMFLFRASNTPTELRYRQIASEVFYYLQCNIFIGIISGRIQGRYTYHWIKSPPPDALNSNV